MNDGGNKHSSDDIFLDQESQTMKVQKREEGTKIIEISLIKYVQVKDFMMKEKNKTDLNMTKKNLMKREENKGIPI